MCPRLLLLAAWAVLQLTSTTTFAQTAPLTNFVTEPVENQEAKTGDIVRLSCTVSDGDVVHWLFNDTQIISASNSDYTVAGGNLTINSFQFEQAGVYRCVASTDGGSTLQVSHAGRVWYLAQRQFSSHPVNFTTHEDTTPNPTGWFPEAPYECTFASVYYGVRPVITWEVQRVGGPVESVPLPDLDAQLAGIGTSDPGLRFRLGADLQTFQRVTFQHDHTGYFQLHFPNRTTENGMRVRCVATLPDDPLQVVKSDWASLTLLDGPIPSNAPTFSSHPPATIHAISGQELVLPCTKGVENETFAIEWFINQTNNLLAFQGFVIQSRAGIRPYGYTNYYLNTSSSHYASYIGSTFYCSVINPATSNRQFRPVMVVSTPPDVPVFFPASDDMSFAISPAIFGTDYSLPVSNAPSQPFNVRWWFNGRQVDLSSGSKYSVDPNSFTLSIADIEYPEGGIYQAEITVSGSNKSEFRNHIVSVNQVHVLSYNWDDVISTKILPSIPSGVTVSPELPSSLNVTAEGNLVSIGRLQSTDANTYIITPRDFTGTSTVEFSVNINGFQPIHLNWKDHFTQEGILPPSPTEYMSNPPFSSRLMVNSTTGDFVSSGQLQSSDASSEYRITSTSYRGTLRLRLTITVGGTDEVTVPWMSPTTVHILPDVPTGSYTVNPPLPAGLEVNSSGLLISSGQPLPSSAHNQLHQITPPSNFYSGTLSLKLKISISGSQTVTLHHMGSTTVALQLPRAPNGYQVMPPLSNRLQVNTMGQLVSVGQLQASDAGTYNITSSNFVGVMSVTLKISVNGTRAVSLDHNSPTNVSLLPAAPSGYQVTPPLSSRLQVSSSGHLVSSGQLQAGDAGTYMINSSDFTGVLTLTISVSVSGSQTVTLHWMSAATTALPLPSSPSGYDVTPPLSSRLQVNSSGHLVSSGQLQASDAGTYMINSSDFTGVLTLMIRISVSGARAITLDHATSTSISILPAAPSNYNVTRPFSSRLQVNSSGHLVSSGQLQASDAGTYMINSSDFAGALTLTISITIGDTQAVTLHWMSAATTALPLPSSPSGYHVTPPLSSRLQVNSSGHLVSSGQLQAGDAGTYMINSSDFTGALTLTVQITVDGTRAVTLSHDTSATITILPVASSSYNVTPSLSTRLQVSTSGQLMSSGQLQASDAGTYTITSSDFTGALTLMIRVTISGSQSVTLHWMMAATTALPLPSSPSGYDVTPPLSSRLQVNSSGHLVSSGQLQASDAGTYMINSSDFTGVLTLIIRISVNGARAITLDHAASTSISILPAAPSNYNVTPPFSSRLQVNSSGHLVSSGQLQASDAGTYMITSNDFTGALTLTISITIGETQTVTLHWIMAATTALPLPSSPSGYVVTPPLSSRLQVNSSGHLVSSGQLQASDAGTYMINSSDFTGALTLTVQITVDGTRTVTLSHDTSATITILPVASSSYNVTPSLSTRLQVSTSGQLMSSGQLQASDAGTYTITSSDFTGALTLMIRVTISGSQSVTLHWMMAATTALPLPRSPSSYDVTPPLSSRLQVNSSGHLVSSGQLQASDAGTYMINSSDFTGALTLTIRISVSGARAITLDHVASASISILPAAPSNYNVNPPLSSRLQVNSSGHLVSSGQLQAGDAGMYMITSSDFTGVLTLTISITIGDTQTVTLHWMSAATTALPLPSSLSGYDVTPPLSSRLQVNSSGHLVSSGQLQASDAGTYMINSSDFTGVLTLTLQISLNATQQVTVHWMNPGSVALQLPTASSGSDYEVTPPLSSRLQVNSSGHLVSSGQLQAGDAGTYSITSNSFTGALSLTLRISVNGMRVVALDHANSMVISILPTASSGYQVSPPFSSRLQVNSSGQLVSAGELQASDAGTYMINSSDFSGTLSLVVRVSISGLRMVSLNWMSSRAVDILPDAPNDYTVTPSLSPRLHVSSSGQLVPNGSLQAGDAGTYMITSGDFTGSLTVTITIDVGGMRTVDFHWMQPGTLQILPASTSGYQAIPAFSSRLRVNSSGSLVSSGQLQGSDAGVYMIMSSDFTGALQLTIHISVNDSQSIALDWLLAADVSLLLPSVSSSSVYQISPSLSSRLHVSFSGQLMSSGQLQASDAGTYTITSSDFTGALKVTIEINITRSFNFGVNWMSPASVPLQLPVAPNGYHVTPPLSSRLQVSSSGHLVSIGQLQAGDAGTFTITSSDFTGALTLMLTIGVHGDQTIVLDWRNPSPKLLPVPAYSRFNVTPPLSSRLEINETGHLVPSGQLQASDAGTFMIMSRNFSGALRMTISISVGGNRTVDFHWMQPGTLQILPTSPSGYQAIPAFSSRLRVNSSGSLVSSGQLQGSDAGVYMITSSDFTGALQLTVHISVNGSRNIALDWLLAANVSLPLPSVSSSGVYQISPPLSSRLHVSSSGQLMSSGQLQASDAGTYTITSSDFTGALKVTIEINITRSISFGLNWMSPAPGSLQLPDAPNGYHVTPPFSSRLQVSSSGHLVPSGRLQAGDAGTYMITSSDFTGALTLMLTIGVHGDQTIVLDWRNPLPKLLPVPAYSGFNVTPPLSSRLDINETGHLVPSGQLQASDAGNFMIMSRNFSGALRMTISVSVSGREQLTLHWMTPISKKILPVKFEDRMFPRFMINSSGFIVSNGLHLMDSSTYNLSSPNYAGTLQVTIVVNAPGYVERPMEDRNAMNASTVILQCSASAHPLPLTYIWKKDGIQIANTTEGQFILTEVTPADVGEYSCCPSNSLGTFNSTSALVNVEIDLTLIWLSRIERKLFPPAPSGYQCRPQRRGVPRVPFEINRDGTFVTTSIDNALSEKYDCISGDINGTLTIDLIVIAHIPYKPKVISSTLTRNNKLNITWTNNATILRPVDTYVLRITTVTPQGNPRGRQAAQERSVTVNTTDTFHVTVDDYDRRQRYEFEVNAVNRAGKSGFSDPHIHIDQLLPPTTAPLTLAPWGMALIVLLVLICCCACCWWIICLILLCCFYRRKRRKVYKAEEREVKYGDDLQRYRETKDDYYGEDERSTAAASDFGSSSPERGNNQDEEVDLEERSNDSEEGSRDGDEAEKANGTNGTNGGTFGHHHDSETEV